MDENELMKLLDNLSITLKVLKNKDNPYNDRLEVSLRYKEELIDLDSIYITDLKEIIKN